MHTLIPTLENSTDFKFWVPSSQSPETKLNLVIRPKTIISSMLVFNSVIHANKWYVSFFAPFSTCTVNRVTHSYDTSVVLPQFYWLKTDRSLAVVFKSVEFFFSSSCANFMFSLLGGQKFSSMFTDTISYLMEKKKFS